MADFFAVTYAEFLGKREIGSVAGDESVTVHCMDMFFFLPSSLVPTLDSGSDRADDDGHIKLERMPPLMGDLESESILLLFVKDIEVLKIGWVLCHQSAFAQEIEFIVETLS